MDFALTEQQSAFVNSVKQFVEKNFKPYAALWDREKQFPKQTLAEAGKLGLMALYCPLESGGLDLNRQDTSIIVEELAKGCTSTAAFITIHNMAINMLMRYGQARLIEEWGPELCAGTKLASYCLTEANAGSDAASLATKAELRGDFYIVQGSKAFISGAGETDILITVVRTGGEGSKGLSVIAIPANLPGIRFGKNEEKMGWNSQPTRAIYFDGVQVPVSHLLGEEGQGFKIAMSALDGGRINIASCSIGTAQAALEAATTYVQERRQFNSAISEFQASQFKLADMATQLVAARQLVRLAAYKLDLRLAEATTYCAMAKRFATDVSFDVCNDALQLHGGYGYIKEYPLERYVRDSRVHQILEGTNEIMRLIIGRNILRKGGLDLIQ